MPGACSSGSGGDSGAGGASEAGGYSGADRRRNGCLATNTLTASTTAPAGAFAFAPVTKRSSKPWPNDASVTRKALLSPCFRY